jgi:hypothetical protein
MCPSWSDLRGDRPLMYEITPQTLLLSIDCEADALAKYHDTFTREGNTVLMYSMTFSKIRNYIKNERCFNVKELIALS